MRVGHVILTGKIRHIHIEESTRYVNQWFYTLRMQPEVIDGIPTEVYCYFNTSEASKLRHLSKGAEVKIGGRLWKSASFVFVRKHRHGRYIAAGGLTAVQTKRIIL